MRRREALARDIAVLVAELHFEGILVMADIIQKVKKAEADFVLEISWEVCNKVGGINTVLATKAIQMLKYYKEGYYLVGPYLASSVKTSSRRGSRSLN